MKAEDIKKMDLNRLRVGQREQALQEVKASLLLDKNRRGGKNRSQR